MIMSIVAVLFMASCTEQPLLNDNEYETTESVRVQETTSISLIKTYTEMARWGDATAYMNLAKCYHDGIGVKADCLTTFAMLKLAAQYGHPDKARAFVDSLPADDNIKMFMNAIDHIDHCSDNTTDSIADALISSGCPDGYSLRGMAQINRGDTIGGTHSLQMGIEMGSTLAEILSCAIPMPGESENETIIAERLSALSLRLPVVNMILGVIYSDDGSNDIEKVHKAAAFYQEADKHGLLNKRQARWLLDYYTREGIQIDEKERERLETIAVKVVERKIHEIEHTEEPIDSVCNDTISILN